MSLQDIGCTFPACECAVPLEAFSEALRKKYCKVNTRRKLPTKEGFYWAKWKIADDGSETFVGASDRWEIVKVTYDAMDSELLADVTGEPKAQKLENFFWGPGPLKPPD